MAVLTIIVNTCWSFSTFKKNVEAKFHKDIILVENNHDDISNIRKNYLTI